MVTAFAVLTLSTPAFSSHCVGDLSASCDFHNEQQSFSQTLLGQTANNVCSVFKMPN